MVYRRGGGRYANLCLNPLVTRVTRSGHGEGRRVSKRSQPVKNGPRLVVTKDSLSNRNSYRLGGNCFDLGV